MYFAYLSNVKTSLPSYLMNILLQPKRELEQYVYSVAGGFRKEHLVKPLVEPFLEPDGAYDTLNIYKMKYLDFYNEEF